MFCNLFFTFAERKRHAARNSRNGYNARCNRKSDHQSQIVFGSFFSVRSFPSAVLIPGIFRFLRKIGCFGRRRLFGIGSDGYGHLFENIQIFSAARKGDTDGCGIRTVCGSHNPVLRKGIFKVGRNDLHFLFRLSVRKRHCGNLGLHRAVGIKRKRALRSFDKIGREGSVVHC